MQLIITSLTATACILYHLLILSSTQNFFPNCLVWNPLWVLEKSISSILCDEKNDATCIFLLTMACLWVGYIIDSIITGPVHILDRGSCWPWTSLIPDGDTQDEMKLKSNAFLASNSAWRYIGTTDNRNSQLSSGVIKGNKLRNDTYTYIHKSMDNSIQ